MDGRGHATYGTDVARVNGPARTTTVDVEPESDAIALEEIVVVGYGEQEKATLTGAATAVSGQEIDRIPATNLSNTVGGKLSGVITLNTSGEPGYDGSNIRIRCSRIVAAFSAA